MLVTHIVLMNLLKGASEVGTPPVIDDGKVPFAKGLAEKGAIEIASSLMGGLE